MKKKRAKSEVKAIVKHINYVRKVSEKNLKQNLKDRVEEAYAISMNIYMQNKDKDKKMIKKMIKDALRPIRFNQGRGYYFIYSMNLKNVLLPISPELEGKDFSNYIDVKGDFVVRNAVKLCKKYGSTFYTWYWRKPDSKSIDYKKIGFDIYFKPFDWFIGTGEYVADFEKNLKKNLLKEIQEIRYGKNGYFFIYSYDGTILTPIKKSLTGKKRINSQDKNNRYLTKDIVNIAKKGGGFFEYTATINPTTKKSEKKISYISGIKEWHWVIGTGENLTDINKTVTQKQKELNGILRKTLIKLGIIFTFIGMLLILLLVFIAKKSEKVFLNYKNMILEETEKSKQHLLLMQNQNKLASMGEMLGNISHQWKQPLNTLGISISKMMLLEETSKLTKKIMLESFDRMEKNIEYLSHTIDVFRDFFKPIQSVEKFYLKKEIKNMVYITQDSFSDENIELLSECEDGIYILGDKKKLEQVFINILNNAKDAIIQNNIDNGRVLIKSFSQEDKAITTIQDNALGIKDEIKDKIFEPYFTTKTNNLGTGVGLYMSKVIIENNFQGSLTFENKDDGALFTMIIPQNLN